MMFTGTFQDARREYQGLHDQLTDAQARHLRLKGQAEPLVKKLDSVRRNIETYEAQKNQLEVCRNVLNVPRSFLIPPNS